MMINKIYGVVADWWFEDRRRLILPTNRSELHQLLKMCQSASEILEKYLLFQLKEGV